MMKPLFWIGSSKDDLLKLPREVRHEAGFALKQAQLGDRASNAKPLSGFGGAGVLEVVVDQRGDTYRAVYTVTFREAVYVLHCFKKKSVHGIATPTNEIALVKRRLKTAQEDHARRKAQLEKSHGNPQGSKGR